MQIYILHKKIVQTQVPVIKLQNSVLQYKWNCAICNDFS